MTKQQPCASRLRLSRICRWLILLGIAKLALFGAWSVDLPLPQLIAAVVDLPLPQIVFPEKKAAPAAKSPADKQPPAGSAAVAQPSAPRTGEVRLAALLAERKGATEAKESAAKESATRRPPERPVDASRVPPAQKVVPVAEVPRDAVTRTVPSAADLSRDVATRGVTPPVADLSRNAAIYDAAPPPADVLRTVAARSAAPLPSMPVVPLPLNKEPRADDEPAVDDGEPSLASGVDASAELMYAAQKTAESNSWWSGILTLTRLPVPVLGVQQIAHAAAADMPPPTVRPSAPGASPFAPPEQSQVRPAAPTPAPGGQGGAPLPLRSPAAQGRGGAGASAPVAPVPVVKSAPSADSTDTKQQELARREQDVLMLKQQMESRLQDLQSAEKKVQGMIKEAHGVHDQKIRMLISAYTNMKPKQAAQALEALDTRLAVRILSGMNPKQAGEVLTYTNPKTVAKLSELMARMQLPGE